MSNAPPARSGLLGSTALVLTVFGFSMTGIWVRWLLALDLLSVTAWRLAGALLVLVPATLLSPADERRTHPRSPRVHLLALRMTAYFTLAVAAFRLAPVSLVALMIGIAPAWILLFQRLAGEPAEPLGVLGVGLALLGASIALGPSVAGATQGQAGALRVAVGAMSALAAGFFNAAFVFGRSRLAARGIRPGAFLLGGISSLWGLLLFAVAPFTRRGALVPATAVEGAWLVALGVISTAVPLWGLGTSSRLLPPLLVALIGTVIPFTAALAAWTFLGEMPPSAFARGAPLVATGIGLVAWPRKPAT